MAKFRIIIWYPTIWDEDDWGKLALEKKCKLLKKAALAALAEFKKKEDARRIFLGPEYVFYLGREDRFCKPIKPIAAGSLLTGLGQLSRQLEDVLFIPGSGMFADEDGKIQNRVLGFLNGEQVLSCAKHDDVGEAPEGKFAAGDGSGTAVINGVTHGLQICKDASHAGLLKAEVGVHLVVSAGLALSNIVNPKDGDKVLAKPRLRVLAERGGVNAESPRECGGVEVRKLSDSDVFTVAAATNVALPEDETFTALHVVMKMWDVEYTD